MYIGIPISIQVSLDKTQHTVQVFELFKEPIHISGRMYSVIGEDYEDTRQKLIEYVKEEIIAEYLKTYRCLRYDDFSIRMNLREIINNRVLVEANPKSGNNTLYVN